MSTDTVARAIADYVHERDEDRVNVLDVWRDVPYVGLPDVKDAVPALADLGIRLGPGRYLETDPAA